MHCPSQLTSLRLYNCPSHLTCPYTSPIFLSHLTHYSHHTHSYSLPLSLPIYNTFLLLFIRLSLLVSHSHAPLLLLISLSLLISHTFLLCPLSSHTHTITAIPPVVPPHAWHTLTAVSHYDSPSHTLLLPSLPLPLLISHTLDLHAIVIPHPTRVCRTRHCPPSHCSHTLTALHHIGPPHRTQARSQTRF